MRGQIFVSLTDRAQGDVPAVPSPGWATSSASAFKQSAEAARAIFGASKSSAFDTTISFKRTAHYETMLDRMTGWNRHGYLIVQFLFVPCRGGLSECKKIFFVCQASFGQDCLV